MRALSASELAPRDDRPATQLLHDAADLRVVAFCLEPGQEVKPHRSRSTVLLQVVEGEGTFSGEDGEATVGAGGTVVYERDELHGIRAGGRRLRFLALIAPRPG